MFQPWILFGTKATPKGGLNELVRYKLDQFTYGTHADCIEAVTVVGQAFFQRLLEEGHVLAFSMYEFSAYCEPII